MHAKLWNYSFSAQISPKFTPTTFNAHTKHIFTDDNKFIFLRHTCVSLKLLLLSVGETCHPVKHVEIEEKYNWKFIFYDFWFSCKAC